MEVKPGYKQTEVGVIPEEWEPISTSKLVDPSAPICYGIVQVGRDTNGGVPTVAIKHVKEINGAPLHRTSIALESSHARSRVKGGDVLISIKGTIGRVGIVPSWFVGNISRDLARLRPKENYSPEYLAHQLEADNTQARISKSVVGTTRLEFSIAALRQFVLPVPKSLAEQHTIASALSDADALIESLKQLIAKKRLIKQGAMQELLTGKRRLPGFKGEWETKSLGEVASASKGHQLHNGEANETGRFPHLNGGIEPSGYTEKSNTPGDTIAISEGGNSCGYVQLMSEPFWCGGHCYAITPIGLEKKFLFHALKAAQPSIMGLRVGSGLPNVQKTALLAFKIVHPKNSEEQIAIADILSGMDAEIDVLEAKLGKAHQVKQGMMQELLTGRIRLLDSKSGTNVEKTEQSAAETKSHNWEFNEAVVISVLAKKFGSEEFPLGRKRYTKLSYLFHRHVEKKAEGYRKMAAGPYNPDMRYKGPEGIAQRNGYIRTHQNGEYSGFIAAEQIAKAESYFQKWYRQESLDWLEQFRLTPNDDLGRLATVDMAMEDLRKTGKAITLASVKEVISNDPNWEDKLTDPVFSDTHIFAAIKSCEALFD